MAYLPALAGKHLADRRDPGHVRHPFVELLRTWVLLLVHGWVPEEFCSQSTLSRLLYVLSGEENEAGLARIVRHMVVPLLGSRREEAALDLDSFPHVVHGQQPGTA